MHRGRTQAIYPCCFYASLLTLNQSKDMKHKMRKFVFVLGGIAICLVAQNGFAQCDFTVASGGTDPGCSYSGGVCMASTCSHCAIYTLTVPACDTCCVTKIKIFGVPPGVCWTACASSPWNSKTVCTTGAVVLTGDELCAGGLVVLKLCSSVSTTFSVAGYNGTCPVICNATLTTP